MTPRRILPLTFVIFLLFFTTLPAKDFVDSEIRHIEFPDWFKDSFLDLKEDLNEALTDGKLGLMILFTTEGCSYCDLFIEKSLGDPRIASRVHSHFDSVGLEIFDDSEMVDLLGASLRIKQFAKREGVEYSPTLLFYGENSERLLRAVGYQSPERFGTILDYLIGRHYRSETFRDYVNGLAAKASASHPALELRADPLFLQPPYALDRSRFPADRPLLVIFEKTACAECEEFHTKVLALNEVRAELEKFEIARFDGADKKTPVLTPDGRKVAPSQWFEQTGFTRVPGLLFFDENGNEVLRTDALVLRNRMMNSLGFVLEKAYKKGWTYQRFARSKAIERQQKRQQ